ncbi:MAG: GIY-YIG nuclease family protein [Porticoccaceae bacterium]
MKSTLGDSFVYIFQERVANAGKERFFKIGFASHNKTDESIKNWKKYKDKSIPVTIIRRIADLQTGNPRRIDVYAVIKFADKGFARIAESRLHRFLSDKACSVPEWFCLSQKEIEHCIESLKQCDGYIEHELAV